MLIYRAIVKKLAAVNICYSVSVSWTFHKKKKYYKLLYEKVQCTTIKGGQVVIGKGWKKLHQGMHLIETNQLWSCNVVENHQKFEKKTNPDRQIQTDNAKIRIKYTQFITQLNYSSVFICKKNKICRNCLLYQHRLQELVQIIFFTKMFFSVPSTVQFSSAYIREAY